jgi:enoyl-CoA hydratase/carnithine racemase
LIEPVGRLEGSIAFPTLNRPKRRNGMNDNDVVESNALPEQFDRDEAFPEKRALICRGR